MQLDIVAAEIRVPSAEKPELSEDCSFNLQAEAGQRGICVLCPLIGNLCQCFLPTLVKYTKCGNLPSLFSPNPCEIHKVWKSAFSVFSQSLWNTQSEEIYLHCFLPILVKYTKCGNLPSVFFPNPCEIHKMRKSAFTVFSQSLWNTQSVEICLQCFLPILVKYSKCGNLPSLFSLNPC